MTKNKTTIWVLHTKIILDNGENQVLTFNSKRKYNNYKKKLRKQIVTENKIMEVNEIKITKIY